MSTLAAGAERLTDRTALVNEACKLDRRIKRRLVDLDVQQRGVDAVQRGGDRGMLDLRDGDRRR